MGPARAGKTGELVIGQAHGDLYEAASRGNVWSACTAVSGVAPGTALGTTSAFYLHNPLNSGKNLVILSASMGYLSGTLGAGSTYLTTHSGVAVANPTGTAITPINGLLAGGSVSGVGKAFTTATVITQIALRPLLSFGPMLATSVFQPTPCNFRLDGEFIVAPGYGIGLHSIATAGTTPLVLFGMSWEEVKSS
jgi:hypothetical protein